MIDDMFDESAIQDFVFDLNDGCFDTNSGRYIARKYGRMLEVFVREYIDLKKSRNTPSRIDDVFADWLE